MNDRMDSSLTDAQKKAVNHKDGPLLVIAGPGSGKTRVITSRIAALVNAGIRPQNICAITFTNKAAQEMRERAEKLGRSGGALLSTFHSLCVRVLRTYSTQAKIKSSFSIYDSSDQLRCAKQAIANAKIDSSNFKPSKMLGAVSTLKNNLETPETFESKTYDFFSEKLLAFYKAYQLILKNNNALDFDDLLLYTALLLEDNSDVSAQLADRFRYLLVDEYQDTNQAQYRIAKALASHHQNICVTGDPDQSIYRWRGADIRNILLFEQDWPEATVVKLEHNFRSTSNILKAADKLIASNKNRKEKVLIPTKPDGNDVLVNECEDAADEARKIAQNIASLVEEGANYSDIAVCYRVNSMSRTLEEAFIQNQVPYQIVRGVEFYGRKEIRDMLAYLKIIANPDDSIALIRIINTPARGIGNTTIKRLVTFAGENNLSLYEALKFAPQIDTLANAAKSKLTAFLNMMEKIKADAEGPVAPLMRNIFENSGLELSLKCLGTEASDQLDNIAELIDAAQDYDNNADEPHLIDYLQQISLFSDADAYDATTSRVALMSLHAAKGLEFEHVFIIGLEDGILPHERSNESDEELEEERRLLFVGITRAKTTLNLSYARYRAFRGQLLRGIPSPFLYELGDTIVQPDQPEEQQEKPTYQYDYASSQQIEPPYKKGQNVMHRKFGLGIVMEFTDMGENSLIVVRFNNGQTKTLMLKYANLSIVEGY